MGFFSNPFKNLIHHPLKFVTNSLPTIGAIIGSVVPGVGTAIGASAGAALGGTAKGLIKGESIGDSLKQGAFSGAGAYAGNAIGDYAGSQIGGTLGKTVGDFTASNAGVNLGQSVAGDSIGNWIGNVAPNIASSIGSQSVGGLLGGAIGMSAGNAMANPSRPQLASAPTPAIGPTPFTPSQQDAQQLPASLSALGGLTQNQQATNLANQGTYGGGNGPQEQSYFMNLLNRRLVDPSGKTGDLSQVNPIEQSYLQRLGISGYGNTNSLLEAMSKWQAA